MWREFFPDKRGDMTDDEHRMSLFIPKVVLLIIGAVVLFIILLVLSVRAF